MQTLKKWIPLAVVLTLTVGLIYVSVQQVYRSGANDPQIQMAEDAVAQLNDGANPHAVVGTPQVEMSSSLAPFLMVFDELGEPLAFRGVLYGSVLRPPIGVLDTAQREGENRVTWEPEEGVRIASVVLPYEGGTVLAGRSLQETEARVALLVQLLLLGWAGSLVVSFVSVASVEIFFGEKPN